MRIFAGAGVGGAIGGLIVLAIACTRWLLRGRPALSPEATAASAGVVAAPRFWLRPWWVNAAIVGLATVIFLLLGSVGGPPAAPPLQPQPQAAAPEPPAPALVAHAQIDVGGVVLAFDPPASYCLYPDDRLQAVLEMQRAVNRDNVVHTVFGDCDQLRAAMQGGARLQDFGMLMTPATLMGQNADGSTIERFATEVLDPVKVKETADQRINEAQVQLRMGSFASVGILDRMDGSLYYGFLSKVTAGGETFDQAAVMAVAVIQRRLVCLYLYSDYGKNPRTALQRLLGRAKAGVADFAALNP
jgi:hypothetical protein